jgi:hypothetical protein
LKAGHGKLGASLTIIKSSLRLTPLRNLRPGKYTLTLISGAGKHKRITSESFTLR